MSNIISSKFLMMINKVHEFKLLKKLQKNVGCGECKSKAAKNVFVSFTSY